VITAPVGVLLGLIGLVTIRPPKRGKVMCLVAVIIGIIATTAWTWVGWWSYEKVVLPMEAGPREALEQGFAGDLAAFRNEFVGSGATATDAEVRGFIDELRRRYGEFQSLAPDRNTQPPMQFGQPYIDVPYTLQFTNQAGVGAQARFVIQDLASNTLALKWESITVIDAAEGNITYPASPSTTTSPAPSSAPSP
jgi:hypothetical protein